MTTTTCAADRTTLLIVDPYNDFMSEGDSYQGDGQTGVDPRQGNGRRSLHGRVEVCVPDWQS